MITNHHKHSCGCGALTTNVHQKPRNPLRVDPTRTLGLRNAFAIDMRKRFNIIKKEVTQLIVVDDAFGLEPGVERLSLNVERQAWRFQTDSQKVVSFRRWLQEQVDAGILVTDPSGKPWFSKYVESAYKQGILRGYRDVYGDAVDAAGNIKDPTQEPLFRISLAGAEETKRLESIYTRTFSDLKGVTDTMAQKLSRVLSLGLADGSNPNVIARRMRKEITTLSKNRATLIARTEIVAAHADGQLDAYATLKVDRVHVVAEWLTAGDERVCDLCAALEGTEMTIEEARGLIPRHPRCRCAWTPVTKRRIQTKPEQAKTRESILDSIQQEKPKKPLKEAKAGSTWLGKERVR